MAYFAVQMWQGLFLLAVTFAVCGVGRLGLVVWIVARCVAAREPIPFGRREIIGNCLIVVLGAVSFALVPSIQDKLSTSVVQADGNHATISSGARHTDVSP